MDCLTELHLVDRGLGRAHISDTQQVVSSLTAVAEHEGWAGQSEVVTADDVIGKYVQGVVSLAVPIGRRSCATFVKDTVGSWDKVDVTVFTEEIECPSLGNFLGFDFDFYVA